jgi:putative membrane protein
MRTLSATLVGALVLVATLPASAQMPNAGFLAAGTRVEDGKPAPDQTNNTDVLFARLLAAGGMAEVAFGELAANKAAADGVKAFGEMMVTDHSRANEQLAALAEAASIPLPAGLDPDHARMQEVLEAAEREAFDLAYVDGQIVDHQKTVQLLQWEIGNGQHAELQRFAAAVLPTVIRHLEAAKALRAELVSG